MKKFLAAWLLAIFLFCNVSAQEVPPTIEEVITALNGDWEWKYSVMSFFPDTVTVEEASPIALSFNNIGPLPPNSIYYTFSGSSVGVATGITEIQPSSNGWSVQFEVSMSGSFPWFITILNADELLFLDGSMVVDGPYAHYFTRVVSNDCSQVNPVITGDLLVNCDYETSTLSTQTYDSYQWYRRGYFEVAAQPIPGATGQTFTATINDVLTYFSVAVTADTCSATSAEVLIDQMVGLPPYVMSGGDFTVDANGNTIVCPGDTLWFTTNGIADFQWYRDGMPIGAVNQNPFPVTQSGGYTVNGNDPICPLYPTGLGLEIGVIAPPKPLIEVLTSGTGLTVSNSDTFATFQWEYNGVPIVGATNPTYLFEGLLFGEYRVMTTDSHNCTAFSNVYDLLSGIGDRFLTKPVLLYPMPVAETLFIGNLPDNGIYNATLYDLSGRVVLQTTLSNNLGLKVNHLPNGMYICKVSDSTGRFDVQKVVVAR